MTAFPMIADDEVWVWVTFLFDLVATRAGCDEHRADGQMIYMKDGSGRYFSSSYMGYCGLLVSHRDRI